MKSIKEHGDTHFLITHEVFPGDENLRLDAFIKARYKKRSRESIKRAISLGQVSISRKTATHFTVGKVKPSSQLFKGDEIQILSERKIEPVVNFSYSTLFEDEFIVVVDKPANLPVHPAGRYFMNTLLVHLRTKGHTLPLHADREYFLAHRIDKETSGVLVLAKNSEICGKITKQFAERTTEKTYQALVHGKTKPTFLNEAPLCKDLASRSDIKMKTCDPTDPQALTALTEFKTLQNGPAFSWVECYPKTGRQHQIRVHLADLGYPIVGDKVYGPEHRILSRHALHAAKLRFNHPVSGQRMEFESPLPKELSDFLKEIS